MERIPNTTRNEIIQRLHNAESDHSIKILYACESGSRAWGFESPDSDYDVRFIYIHDKDWYLSFDVEQRRDVIEYPIVGEIDCSGWDLRKALYLFTRTNGALLEWLTSPIKYIETGTVAENLRTLAPQCFNKSALCYHYSHMASGNAKECLFSDSVKLKKYFYVLRPLFAIRFVEHAGKPPPIEFEKLMREASPKEIIPAIENLLDIKKRTPEMGYGKPVLEINAFIKSELARHGEAFKGQDKQDLLDKAEHLEKLNEIFRNNLI
jgi:uncharacterized protein